MRMPVAGLAGAIVVIVALSLLFGVSVASRMAPEPIQPHVTGPADSCRSNADCWCASFDGAEFLPGVFVPSTCESKGVCSLCIYE